MEKLMKPAEYAKEIGISRQAVYAKIKKGILRSKSVEGKLYIVVDSDEVAKKPGTVTQHTGKSDKQSAAHIDYEALLKAKDETIEVLKGTVKDLKESNREISTTLRGEIDLLKEAFHEMRTLYAHQLEQKQQAQKQPEMIDVHSEVSSSDDAIWDSSSVWVGFKKFLKYYEIEKNEEKIRKRLKKAYKRGDHRIMKKEGKLKMDLNETYEDILQS
jgi:predicted DNA-binding protein YlxM (UPF0122 family)